MSKGSDWYRRPATLVLAASAVIFGGSATAQTAAAAPTTPQAQGGLDEIVVTAQRRSQSVQDVPIDITALTGGQLQTAGITSLLDLNQATPGLQVVDEQGNGTVWMRGVGSANEAAGAEGSVAIYLDDVYYAAPAGVLLSLANVDRVEVLKGPQGTLYGRNATGGLVNVITPDPEVAPLVKVNIARESFDAVVGSVFVTGGVDRLQGSLSIDVRHQGVGYGHYFGSTALSFVSPGQEINFQDYQNYRGKLSWEPTDADRLTLSANYYRSAGDYGLNNAVFPGTTDIAGTSYSGRPWDAASVTGQAYTQTKDLALHWNHGFDGGPTLKSISAYRQVYYDEILAVTVPIFINYINTKQWSFQQEFLLQDTKNVLNHKLDYTAGLFYFNSHASPYAQRFGFTGPPFDPLLDSAQYSATKSYAVYGQMDYHLTDRDTLTVGGRYTWDRQAFHATSGPVLAQPPTAKFGEPTWRLALKHQLADQWMVYGSLSRGYKSGLYDNSTIQADGSVNLVKPEFLSAYEIGTKGTFLNGNLQLSLNGFYWDYSNIQVQYFNNGQVLLQNAGKARIYGLEPEAAASVPVPVGKLQLHVTASFLSNEYTNFDNCSINTPLAFPPGGNAVSIGSCGGNHLLNAPEQVVTAGFDYSVPDPTGGRTELGAELYHSGTVFYGADNTLKQNPYNTFNAHISYEFADGRTRLRVYGRNLSNAHVINYATAAFFESIAFYNPPRIGGIELQYRWQ